MRCMGFDDTVSYSSRLGIATGDIAGGVAGAARFDRRESPPLRLDVAALLISHSGRRS